MNRARKAILLIAMFFSFISSHAQVVDEKNIIDGNKRGYLEQVLGINVPEIFSCELYDAVASWMGTPYKYAGSAMTGIDCSNLVHKIYDQAFGLAVSGTSLDLFRQVKKLKSGMLREGDLVFFRIRKRAISHVGIYLGNNKFAHSSRTSGVTISDLSTPYYKMRLAGFGRLPQADGLDPNR